MKNLRHGNDINLLEVFMTIYNNKLKVVLITIITAMVIVYVFPSPNDSKFKMISTTKSISSFDEFDYNSYNFFRNQYYPDPASYGRLGQSYMLDIDKFFLFNLFMKILEEEMLAKGIEKFGLVKKEDYKDEKAYLSAIEQFKSSIKISIIDDEAEEKAEGKIEFVANDEDTKEKWENLLNSLEVSTNRLVQKYLKERILESKKSVENIKKNSLDDIELSIKNVLVQYELETTKRIIFLKEQAQIARAMPDYPEELYSLIPKGNMLNSAYGLNSDYFDLYYLRGHQVIEKEIEVLKSRKDKSLIAKGVPELLKEKAEIINDKRFERVYSMLERTPIFDNDKFFAGLVLAGSSKFTTNAVSIYKKISVATIFGLIISIFYVLIANALTQRLKKLNKKKN